VVRKTRNPHATALADLSFRKRIVVDKRQKALRKRQKTRELLQKAETE